MSGNYTYEFEDWLARRNHQPYAVTCHSGTQALEIIAEWYGEHNWAFLIRPLWLCPRNLSCHTQCICSSRLELAHCGH
jgi:hypothetical protein